MRTHARRFRSIFRRPPSLPARASLPAYVALSPRVALPLDPEPVVLGAPGGAEGASTAGRVKAWLRVGAHTLLAVLWVALPQLFVGLRGRGEAEPLVVEVDRPCHCGRAASIGVAPSLRDSLAPKDDVVSDEGEGEAFAGRAFARPRPPSPGRGTCESVAPGAPRGARGE